MVLGILCVPCFSFTNHPVFGIPLVCMLSAEYLRRSKNAAQSITSIRGKGKEQEKLCHASDDTERHGETS